MKYLIIGGVAGGATVAARLRRMDEKAEIILFERGKYVSYANCGLPYYIGDTINDRNKLFVQTVKGFTDRFRIDIRTEQEATRILPESKQVEVKKLGTGETYTETYDKLVLSPGAEPLRPRIEGIESKKIFTLRNVPDTDTIKNYVNTEKPRTAVVVGGGFIGLEMAENLHELGVHVTVVEMANQVMAPLDYSMAAIVHQQLIGKQVGLMLEDGVSRFEETSRGVTVHLKSGKQIPADMVLLSIGVRPETRLAKEAGLTIGALGGIAVNEYMQTSNPDIYALGDAVEVRHLVTGKPALIPLAGPANKQGRIVADNIVSGNKETYDGTMGTSIAKVFDLTVATAGANAKLLKREGIAYQSSYTHGASHAGYYPGAVPLSIKILFAPEDGRLRLPTAYHSGEGVCGGFQDLRIQFTPHPDRRRPLRPATRGSYQHGHHPLLHASKTERLPNQHRADRDRYHQPYRPGRDGRRRVFHRAFRREGMERNPATHRLRRSRLSDLS